MSHQQKMSAADAALLMRLTMNAAARPDDPEAHMDLAFFFAVRENFAQAEAPLRRALELAPDDPVVANNLGMCLGGLERHAESETLFRRVIALVPGLALGHENLAVILKKQRRFDEALQALNGAMGCGACTPNVFYNFAEIFYLKGDQSSAMYFAGMYRGLVREIPDLAQAAADLMDRISGRPPAPGADGITAFPA